MKSTRLAAVIGTAAITAAGLAALAGCGTTTKAPAAAATPAASATPADPSYSYYQTMMQRLYGGGSMMGGSYGWMMGATGYQWMMGGAAAPAWMRGQALPGFMMGTSSDPGKVMGSMFANAPGPRVSAAQAAQAGSQVPAGATLDRAANTIPSPAPPYGSPPWPAPPAAPMRPSASPA